MARTPAFDREAVVHAALGLFWARGYEDASVPELETATGLSRSSIYNAFGSKRGLFDAAVRSYLDDVVRPRLQALTAETVEPEALTRYLDGLADAFGHRGSPAAENGCLLINAAGAPIAREQRMSQIIDDYRAELRAALARGVDARMPAREPADRILLTDAVSALVIAAFALVRVSPAQAVQSVRTAQELLLR